MGEEMELGCARPTGGPVGEPVEPNQPEKQNLAKEVAPMVRVGKKAPQPLDYLPAESACVAAKLFRSNEHIYFLTYLICVFII